MAKQRTLNEIRQSKEYYIAKQKVEETNENPFDHNHVAKLVDKIADKLQSEIFDVIFQAVNDEMSKYYTFQDTNYLTEAGLELFEDEWFEFYHENHGRIMYKLLQNLK